jgi:uncharacterized caspase-like protein
MSFFKKTIALFFLASASLSLYAQLRLVPREPTDMFIFYSTSPGQDALDGTARNSPFAESFLKNVDRREPLLIIASDIARDTLALTAQRQRPVFESTIISNSNYSIASGSSARRYALVIGNGNYYNINGKNANPANDAQDITAALRKFGYEVDLRIDVDFNGMHRAIGDFIGKLEADRNSEGFFWFGGFGLNINNENYLLPADIRLTSESEIRRNSVSLNTLKNELESAGNNINLVFLDAGRTSLFSSGSR